MTHQLWTIILVIGALVGCADKEARRKQFEARLEPHVTSNTTLVRELLRRGGTDSCIRVGVKRGKDGFTVNVGRLLNERAPDIDLRADDRVFLISHSISCITKWPKDNPFEAYLRGEPVSDRTRIESKCMFYPIIENDPKPNKAPEPATTAVTPPAAQEQRHP